MGGIELTIIEVLGGTLVAGAMAWGGLLWAKLSRIGEQLEQLVEDKHREKTEYEVRMSRLEMVCERFEREMEKLKVKCPVVGMGEEHGKHESVAG